MTSPSCHTPEAGPRFPPSSQPARGHRQSPGVSAPAPGGVCVCVCTVRVFGLVFREIGDQRGKLGVSRRRRLCCLTQVGYRKDEGLLFSNFGKP